MRMDHQWNPFIIMCLWMSLVLIVFAVAKYACGFYAMLVGVTAILTGAIVTDRILFAQKYTASKQALRGLSIRESDRAGKDGKPVKK